MEVAEQQWRREWAGTAEYGKVVEGGVTRRIARAMEVLHASGPGARMKVMRAAYHTTAGPGVPASSVMVHASRRVYSSGFDFRDPPSLSSQPLEISSTPLALLQDPHADTENYKVTEPDDLEISEPSKWKSSTGGSIRMPSEESSSTDNASIIDLDARNHKNVFRKYSCDSENSERSSRVSPLLDVPALSTLKFRTFLNNHSDWNNRRKSYSFEDTSPLTETILHSNDTLAMESSTDSGICKSTEIVNDNQDDIKPVRYYGSNDRGDKRDETFQNWLSNNKQNNYYKGTKFKSYRDREIENDPKESNITLQSTGKVSITLPITLETEQEYESRKNYEENQRKMKRVEFCKTELHFAAETGRVNIIATDEKPPPSNDFRKRRSAFVPMRDVPERPITLFGEKSNDFPNESNSQISEYNEIDENTAATKSILKNKIPKPKPYLLGENMTFGVQNERKCDETGDLYVPTAVSLINKQLQSEKRYFNEESASFSRQHVSTKTNEFRATNQGPLENMASKNTTYSFESGKQKVVRIHDEKNKYNSAKKTSAMIRSPTPARLKTRELRESDLTYFGVDSGSNKIDNDKHSFIKPRALQDAPAIHDIFQSVRLIQQVSNSVCNSESEDMSEYQNVPINTNYVPKPTPRLRSNLDDKPNYIDEIVLRPILEQGKIPDIASRRSKLKNHEEINSMKSRSRSEPRKSHNINSLHQTHRQVDQSSRSTKEHSISDNESQNLISTKTYKAELNPIYVNLNKPATTKISKLDSKTRNAAQNVPRNNDSIASTHRKLDATKSNSGQDIDIKHKPNRRQIVEEKNRNTLENNNNSLKRNKDKNQLDKTDKMQLSRQKKYCELSNESAFDTGTNNSSVSKTSNHSNLERKEHRSRSLHRQSNAAPKKEKLDATSQSKKSSAEKTPITEFKVHKRQPSTDKTNTRTDITKVMPKVVQNSNTKKDSTSGRPSHREYVINYDDKNGTVSSICKIRPGSGSPRRKKVVKEVVKEKFKENLKNKSSDKAALLQPEGHQRNSNTRKGERKWKKAHIERSCQML